MSAWSRPRGACGTRRAYEAVGRGRCAGPARGTQLCCCGVATAATWCLRGIGPRGARGTCAEPTK
eukprot:5786440-Prymnesium_polylepis.1